MPNKPKRYPEEPLYLISEDGGGYYPAKIHQQFHENKYKIIRKLGFGHFSTTWLVLDSEDGCHYALKIFTSAASKWRTSGGLVPILKSLRGQSVLAFHDSFWEQNGDDSHLCVVTNPLSTSVLDLQEEAEGRRLPVHAVQKIVRIAADALEGLHEAKIMHGAADASSIFFSVNSGPEFIKRILDSEPAPRTTGKNEYITVRSQPLTHSFKWNDKIEKVNEWQLCLGRFSGGMIVPSSAAISVLSNYLSIARQSNYRDSPIVSFPHPPETLLGNYSCSPQTDIWMLGNMAFDLLTGKDFHECPPGESDTRKMAAMRAVLQDELPDEWLSDPGMMRYDATAHGPVISIEESLSGALSPRDAVEAAAFIKSCLRMDPTKRLTATECKNHRWLSTPCSCCEVGEVSI